MPTPPQQVRQYIWNKPEAVHPTPYSCGYCSNHVSSEKGLKLPSGSKQRGAVYVCPECNCPTFIYHNPNLQVPGPTYGNLIDHLPHELDALYAEARQCITENANTAAVLVLRKMLMNVAVDQGAEEKKSFIEYVNYLADNGWVPPNGKHWVDHIRKKGNEATHEIHLMTADDAKPLLSFMEFLLRFAYEFPRMIPDPSTSEET